jgi:TolB protein
MGSFCLLLLVVASLVLCCPRAGLSRIYIDIHSPTQGKIPIAIPAFQQEEAEAGNHAALQREPAQILSEALAFSGLFEVLNPAVFLQKPEEMGVELEEIKFPEWRFLGADLLVRGSYRIESERLVLVIRLVDVVHRKLLLEKTYEEEPAAVRRGVLRFADDMVLELTGERGVFHTRIAFIGDATEHKEVYLADFDGSNLRQLTRDGSLNLSPSWSSDGERIAYVSYKQGNPDLYVRNLITETERCISKRPGLNIAPAWHPTDDGLAVTLTIHGNSELYLLDVRGRILRQLTRRWSIDVSPSWSPDGRRLAYVSNRGGQPQIYVLDLANGRSRRLTFEGAYNTSPAWSPRGDRIAYAGFHDGHFDVFLISPEGEKLRQLTGGSGNNENPCWSPDGRLILFQSDRLGTETLWVMLANGTDQRRLHLELGGNHTEPAWSPRLTETAP